MNWSQPLIAPVMLNNNKKNTMENRKLVILLLRVICGASFAWLAVTTGYTVFQASKGWGSPWLQWTAVIVMWVLVDAYSANLSTFSIRAIIDRNFRADIGGLTFALVFILFAGRFTASTFMTYVASKPLAEAVTPPPNTNEDSERLEQSQSQHSGRLDALKEEKERLERSEKQRVREATKEGNKMVNAAIEAGGANFARLYQSGNDWVKTDRKFRKTREAIKAAKVQADGLVFIEKEATREAQKAYLAALGGKDEVTTALASVMQQKQNRYESNVGRWTVTLYLVDFLAAILAILTRIAIVKFEMATNVQYKSIFTSALDTIKTRVTTDLVEATEKTGLAGWGLIFTGFAKIPTLLNWLRVVIWVKLIGKIETLLKVDIDGDGKIGDKEIEETATKSMATSLEMVGDRRPIIEGFVLNKTATNPGDNISDNTATKSGDLATNQRRATSGDTVFKSLATNPQKPAQKSAATNPATSGDKAPKKKRRQGDKQRTPYQAAKDRCRAAYRRYRNGEGTKEAVETAIDETIKRFGCKAEIGQGTVHFTEKP